MTDWNERIAKAALTRDDLALQKAERERQQQAARERESAEGEIRRRQDLEKLKAFLKSIGADDILEKAKAVWRTGTIVTEIDEESAKAKTILETSYRGTYQESGSSDYGYSPRTLTGIWRDRLLIEAFTDLDSSLHLSVLDLHEFKTSGGWFDSDGPSTRGRKPSVFVNVEQGNNTDTRGNLEEIVLGLCEARVIGKTLPFDHRAGGR